MKRLIVISFCLLTLVGCAKPDENMLNAIDNYRENIKMEYKTERFDNIFELKDFLNEKEIDSQNIISIIKKDNEIVDLLYIEREK